MDKSNGGAPPSPSWLSRAFVEIERTPHLYDGLCDILRAFGRDDGDVVGPANLHPDDVGTECTDAMAHLQQRIATELLDEIDADQASMFGRRFSSVSALLKEKGGSNEVTNERLLRLALHRRAVQILSTQDPVLSRRRALRIRALVDFIWSTSLVIGLKDSEADHPTLEQLAQSQTSPLQYNEFSPGFHHATIEGMTSDFGPVHINVLRIDMRRSKCRMKCVDARSTCTDLPKLAEQMGAVAAISGGFFLYSEPDICPPSERTDPVGLLVSEGEAVGPPVFRRAAILQTVEEDGDLSVGLDKVGMDGVTITLKFPQQSLDLTVGRDNIECIHRGDAEEVAIEEGYFAFSIVGNTVVDRKTGPSSTEMPVPLAGYVLVFPRDSLAKDAEIMCGDATINVSYSLPKPYNRVESAMAGGPMFFSDECDGMDLPSEDFSNSAPPVTFSQDETHDHNLLPRMGVGLTKNGKELICVAVDGRNLDRALGLTLQGTSNLLKSLGCCKAMNLDGGSSKRMVIWNAELKRHEVVCLSTTEIKANNGQARNNSGKEAAAPSRPVHSAILFLPNGDDD